MPHQYRSDESAQIKVFHLVSLTGSPESGLFTALLNLCAAQVEAGWQVKVIVPAFSRKQLASTARHFREAATVFDVLSPISFVREVAKLSRQSVILHVHSLWTMASLAPLCVDQNRRARVVFSPHGTLAPPAFAHHRIRKEAAWWTIQRFAFLNADAAHATSEKEANEIRRRGFQREIGLVPNAVPPSDNHATHREEGAHTLLFLGRLHPIKGLDILIDAWETLEADFPNWKLRIVGPEGAPGYLTRLQHRARSLKNVLFDGSLIGNAKSQAFASADIFVAPSESENFGYSIAEALASGLPIVVTSCVPWPEATDLGFGWQCEFSAAELRVTLVKAMRCTNAERAMMGAIGQKFVAEKFGAKTVTSRLRRLYHPQAQSG